MTRADVVNGIMTISEHGGTPKFEKASYDKRYQAYVIKAVLGQEDCDTSELEFCREVDHTEL